jgi:hypothetical protein
MDLNKFSANLGDFGFFMMVSLIDVDTWFKLITGIVIAGLVITTKVQDILIKQKENKLKKHQLEDYDQEES